MPPEHVIVLKWPDLLGFGLFLRGIGFRFAPRLPNSENLLRLDPGTASEDIHTKEDDLLFKPLVVVGEENP
ncbi:hypothetical protein V2J09_009581 [Rumex salicifolius]